MAKRIFALLVFLSAGAQANGPETNSSGCVMHDEIIYEEVTASGWRKTGADLVFTSFQEPAAVICTGMAQTVSAAISSAMPLRRNAVTRQVDIGRQNGKGGVCQRRYRGRTHQPGPHLLTGSLCISP